jgi:RNA polymerase sigma-70 factor (ECF subfamily)
MDENEWLAQRFEEQRAHLRAVAYRMLGSLPEADDAIQDAWVRASRAGVGQVDNLGGWLTTIVARVCLNMLRARNVRREESLEGTPPRPGHQPRGRDSTGGRGPARRLGRPGSPGGARCPGPRRAPGLRPP